MIIDVFVICWFQEIRCTKSGKLDRPALKCYGNIILPVEQKALRQGVADHQLPLLHLNLTNDNVAQLRQTGDVGASAGIGWQLAESHLAHAISER